MTVGSEVRTCLANVKNIEATLDLFATLTKSDESRTAFEEANEIIVEIKKDLDDQLIMLMNEEPQYKK